MIQDDDSVQKINTRTSIISLRLYIAVFTIYIHSSSEGDYDYEFGAKKWLIEIRRKKMSLR